MAEGNNQYRNLPLYLHDTADDQQGQSTSDPLYPGEYQQLSRYSVDQGLHGYQEWDTASPDVSYSSTSMMGNRDYDSGMPLTSFKEDTEQFKNMRIEDWEIEHTIDWFKSVCNVYNINCIDLKTFSMRGIDLLGMKLQDFHRRVGVKQYAKVFYDDLKALQAAQNCQDQQCQQYHEIEDPSLHKFSEVLTFSDEYPTTSHQSTSHFSTSSSSLQYYGGSYESPFASQWPHDSDSSRCDLDMGAHGLFAKLDTKRDDRKKGPEIWQFVARLLHYEKDPSVIDWVDQAQGIFQIKRKDVVAKKWGERSQKRSNPNYSYATFRKSLTYHYTTGKVVKVDEANQIYKLGPEAMDFYWNTVSDQL